MATNDIANVTLAHRMSAAYPGLEKHLRENGSDGLICLSLGEDGHYFLRSEWGAAWNLPESTKDHVGLPGKDYDSVELLFLGIDDAYYAETRNPAVRWDFKGNYDSLDATIRHRTPGVRCLDMNLQDDRCFSCFSRMAIRSAAQAELS